MPAEAIEIEDAAQTAQVLLPFAEKEYVDLRRACRILNVSQNTLNRMAGAGLIGWVNYGKASWKRLRYQSIVEFCEQVRLQHHIADRKPQLSAPYLRHRDEDLLPFPVSDTIATDEACAALGYRRATEVVKLIEEGKFEAYQLVPMAPWRVSRSSLIAYISRCHNAPATQKVRPYKVPTTSPHF